MGRNLPLTRRHLRALIARDRPRRPDIDPTDARRAALATALIGAATTAGKLGWDHLHLHAHDQASSRRFALQAGERAGAGTRRIARGRIDKATERIEGGYDNGRGPDAEAVHGARKDIKRLRTTIRLMRDAVGKKAARKDNARLREAARRLAGARDSEVMLELLNGLVERHHDELAGSDLHGLRASLEIERDRAAERLRSDPHSAGAFVEDLRAVRTHVAGWNVRDGGFDAFAPGLRRIYRRGRRDFHRAARDPSVEALHEWRKRVKDLRHTAEILRPRAARLRPVVKRSKRLGDLLGEDHDLALLGERASKLGADALAGVTDRRREELRDAAFALGAKLYRRKPRPFVKRIAGAYDRACDGGLDARAAVA